MTNPDIHQAKQWAKEAYEQKSNGVIIDGIALATARVIQSLPDRWVDAEKVADLADDMSHWKLPDGPSNTETDYLHLVEIMDGFIGRINDLVTPGLPTLADLIDRGNDPQQYQWMQAESASTGNRFVSHGVITAVNPQWLAPGRCMFLAPDGFSIEVPWEEVTPFPYLPRLEWLGSGDTPTVAEQENVAPDQQVNPQVNLDSSRPRPEDVPVGEAWLVKTRDGEKREALKTSTGWMVKDGDDVELWVEEALEPVARLVPEDKP